MANTNVPFGEAQVDPRDLIIAQLRRENRYLRSKMGDRPVGLKTVNTIGRILRRALDDALSLLALRAANYQVTRQLARELGISERRYYWALGLLRSASVLRANRWRIDAAASLENHQAAYTLVQTRYAELRERGDALAMLRLYLPKKMDYTYAGKP